VSGDVIAMRPEFTRDGFCCCGLPEKWARDPLFPVRYRAEVGEYEIIHGKDGNFAACMYYCFFCGGKIPGSTRDSQFTELSPVEVDEVRSLCSGLGSVEDILPILGEPDTIDRWEPSPDLDVHSRFYGAEKWKEGWVYSERWKSLNLTVLIYPDGRVAPTWSAKHIAECQ